MPRDAQGTAPSQTGSSREDRPTAGSGAKVTLSKGCRHRGKEERALGNTQGLIQRRWVLLGLLDMPEASAMAIGAWQGPEGCKMPPV